MIQRLALLAIFSGLLITCASNSKEPVVQKVDLATFSQKLQSLEDIQLVDVRTPEEFDAGTIENSVNMNFHGENFDQQLTTLDKNKPVMIYCQAGAEGGRSGQTLAKLKEMGFQEVYELAGGYAGWSAAKE